MFRAFFVRVTADPELGDSVKVRGRSLFGPLGMSDGTVDGLQLVGRLDANGLLPWTSNHTEGNRGRS